MRLRNLNEIYVNEDNIIEINTYNSKNRIRYISNLCHMKTYENKIF